MPLLFATQNAHKAHEVAAILDGTGIELITLLERPDIPEPPETGTTFVENALQKARHVHELTGLPVIADDSGIEVDALGGAPGIHSKRFSPEGTDDANNQLLLHQLKTKADRTARYRCVLAIVTATQSEVVEAACEGKIAIQAQGSGGFGYDPYFLPDEAPGRTMAQLTLAEKNAISHRGRAFRRLPELLARVGESP